MADKLNLKKVDAEFSPVDSIDGYTLNNFKNRKTRRGQAKRMGLIKEWSVFNKQITQGDNKQTWREVDHQNIKTSSLKN